MNPRFLAALCAACWAFAGPATAQEGATTNRATELKERPAAEAGTVAPLGADVPVTVLARQGAWTQVEAGGRKGWVRAFHLRFRASVATSSSSGGALGGLAALVGVGKKAPDTSRTAALGIRGLTPEDFRNASPDAAELAKMQSYRAEKSAAERFAAEAKLAAVAIPYPKEER